jgi:hypothetical protein
LDDEVTGEIARVRAEARARADAAGTSRPLPGFVVPEVEPPPAPPAAAPAPELPSPPDTSAVNESWRPPSLEGGGVVGMLRRAVDRLVRRQLAARVRFASDQVRFDNELVAYVAAHFAATHRHYDRLIAAASVRMDGIDERHRQLQRRLASGLEDLARRGDVVLEMSERSRLSGEADLRRIAPRLLALEQRLDELEQRLRQQGLRPDEE